MKKLSQAELNARKVMLATLQNQVAELEKEIEEGTVSVNPDAHAHLASVLRLIANKTKHRSLRRLCVEALNHADKGALEQIAKTYRRQGVNTAIDTIRAKVMQAKEMNSELTMLVGEVYITELQKLLE